MSTPGSFKYNSSSESYMANIYRLLIHKGWLVLSLLVTICLIGLAWNPIWALYYQRQAGKLLEKTNSGSSAESVLFACRDNNPQSKKVQNLALQAISLLNKTKQLSPHQAYVDLLLGKAYCTARNYNQAIQALDAFTQERPDNILGYLELGFAYTNHFQSLRESIKSGKKSTPRDFDRYAQRIKEVWEKAHLSEQSFLDLGDHAFWSRNYADALNWYTTADVIQPLNPESVFRAGIIELFLKKTPFFSEDEPSTVPTLKLNQKIAIPASSMYSFSAVKPIPIENQDNIPTGVLSNIYDQAFVLVDFPASQDYCMTLRALDLPPKPTILELNLDLTPRIMFELSYGNRTWSDFTYRQFIEQGVHVISIKLVNDQAENGQNPNGYIRSLSVESCGG